MLLQGEQKQIWSRGFHQMKEWEKVIRTFFKDFLIWSKERGLWRHPLGTILRKTAIFEILANFDANFRGEGVEIAKI